MTLEYYINQVLARLGEGYTSINDRVKSVLINCINAQLRTGNYSEYDIHQFIMSERITLGDDKLSKYELTEEILRKISVMPPTDQFNNYSINEVSFFKYQYLKDITIPVDEIYYCLDGNVLQFYKTTDQHFEIIIRYIYFPEITTWTINTDLSNCSLAFMNDACDLAVKYLYEEISR